MAQLLDAHGRPVSTADLKREMAAPMLAGIRMVWGDTVASGLTPNRLGAILRNSLHLDQHEYLTLAEEIEERDLHYGSVLRTRKLAVTSIEATVEAASDDKADVDLADAIRELVRDPGFGEMVDDLLDALGKGYSAVELLWETSAGQWRPAYVWRDPRFFQFDRVSHSELRLRDTADLVNGLDLPPYKFVVHRPRLKTGIPIRGGLARLGVWGYLFKAYTLKDWMAFIEVFGMPMRLGKYAAGASEDDIRKLLSAVVNLGSDAAAVIHESMQIEFNNAVQGTGNNELFLRAAEFWDKQISKAVLGQVATTEGTPGKLGNEDAQKEVREDLIRADARQLANTLNRDLVRGYIDLNFGPQKTYPRIEIKLPEAEDLAQLTTSLAALVPLGFRVEQSVIRDKLGLPEPAKDAEILASPAPPEFSPPPFAANRPGPGARLALARNITAPLALPAPIDTSFADLDAIAEGDLADWEPAMAPLLTPLRELVARTQSYEELVDGLTGLLGQMDTDALVRMLGRALFLAKGAGDAGRRPEREALARNAAEFVEAEHPRDDAGEFANKGSGKGKRADTAVAEKKSPTKGPAIAVREHQIGDRTLRAVSEKLGKPDDVYYEPVDRQKDKPAIKAAIIWAGEVEKNAAKMEAIKAYSDAEAEEYTAIVKAWRSGDEKSPAWQAGKAFLDAVDDAPKWTGAMYRGMNLREKEYEAFMKSALNAQKADSVFAINAMQSFSRDSDIAEGFDGSEGTAEKPHGVILHAASRSARMFESASGSRFEEEVLSLPGTKFKVMSIQEVQATQTRVRGTVQSSVPYVQTHVYLQEV